MAIARQHNRIRELDNRVMEALHNPAASDTAERVRISGIAGGSAIESQKQHTWSALVAICNTKLLSQVAQRTREACAVLQLDVVDTEANVIQETGTDGVCPVDNFIVDGRVREPGAQHCQ